jgi:hypothetical protein
VISSHSCLLLHKIRWFTRDLEAIPEIASTIELTFPRHGSDINSIWHQNRHTFSFGVLDLSLEASSLPPTVEVLGLHVKTRDENGQKNVQIIFVFIFL